MSVLLQSCTVVDDYMLGKDNTPIPEKLPEISKPKVKVSQNWTAASGKSHSNNDYLKIKPVIHGNLIYTADNSGLVQAVDRQNGQVKWSKQLKHGVLSGPIVAEGSIVVSTSASSIVLLDQADGKELWNTKLSGEVLAPPAMAHKKVVAKTIDGKVFALDARNGKPIWTADHGSPNLILKASSSPILVNNLVILGFSDGKLEALELDTGRPVWQKSIAYASGGSDVERLVDIDADPIIVNNVAYLASYQGYIGALSLNDGQFLWKKPGSVYKNMVLQNNTLYYTDSNDVLWSLNRHTGRVNWKQTSLKARGLTEPVIVGKDIVVGDKTGLLHFIEAQTGELLARKQLSAGINNSPSVSGQNLYVLTNNGMLNQLSVS